MIRAAARNAAARILSTFFGFGACVLEINWGWLDESYESRYHMTNKRGGRSYVFWKIDDAITNKGRVIACTLCLIHLYPIYPFRSTYLWALSSSSLNNDGFASNWCTGTNVLSSSDHLDALESFRNRRCKCDFWFELCCLSQVDLNFILSHNSTQLEREWGAASVPLSLSSTFSFYVNHIIYQVTSFTLLVFPSFIKFLICTWGYTQKNNR